MRAPRALTSELISCRASSSIMQYGHQCPSEEADHQRSFAQKVVRCHLHVILIEQCEALSTVPDFHRASFEARAWSSAVARCIVSIASCGALYGGAPDSNVLLNSSRRS